MKQETKVCKKCGDLFERDCSRFNWRLRKYCSMECSSEAMKVNNKGICFNTGRTHIKKGQNLSPATQFKTGQQSYWKGKKNPHFTGPNNPRWKGGITPEHKKIRWSQEYKDFRDEIFKRDGYTCLDCGRKRVPGDRVILNAHHKKSFAKYFKLRFVKSNVITICKECHGIRHKKG